ncbi:hypothetical protein V9T40_011004 [Parthenolecanium corni]|uniref:Uncharacterized protein n=1 Tax=Parthenolecanium corni TaxID=536013 RepID=A0AAN9T8G3_9HEMI
MPAIGPVYQPTTYHVGYEQHSDWSQQPRRNRMSKLRDWLQSDECCRRIFIASCVVIVLFIVLVLLEFIFAGVFGQNLIDHDYPPYTVILYVCFTIVGVAFIVVLALVYLRFVRHKRFYFWPFVRKESLARQMSNQVRNGQAMVLNPSTDLLVTSAQYGPVTEPPPTMHEEDETRNLMSSDHKEMNEEVEERPLESDPRIVLRPPGHRDDA